MGQQFRWTPKKQDEFLELRKSGLTVPQTAQRMGVSYFAAKKAIKRYQLYVGRVQKKAKEPTLDQFSEQKIREELSKRGYKVEKVEEEKVDRKFKIDPAMFEGTVKKFAIISCTQIGSKYQQLTYLKNFYKRIQDEGIMVVLHCGDITDGINVYRGHEYDLFLHGADAQEDYTVEHYPKMENGGKTYAIMGNHDYSFIKEANLNILQKISQRRPDIVNCGAYGAFPSILGLKIYMQHGGGGVAYARSYRLQKMIEQLAPASKPDLYFLGHYHVSCGLFEYRNVIGFMIPCFQAQTPHLRRLGLYPEIGGLIIEITENDRFRKGGIASMKFEWIPFYVPKENDY